ncbi:MAG TPA: metallophosphoesterase [Noviherbaspirillum sp.]|jgi:predicted MPP superfamily phosphohydrolase|uniref:metallophosphoesterase n=1 Tax=Noviherbaspirillum sp. TaxID=1926288 RepID=UPI002F930950
MRFRPPTALIILAVLHAYIGLRILPALPIALPLKVLGAVWLAASMGLIPAGFMSHAIRRQPLADRMAWAGFLALGLFSSLFVLTLVRDVMLVAAALIGAYGADLVRWSGVAVPVLALFAALVGLFNARRVAQVVHVEIPVEGLPEALHGFTIAQISDIHVGPTIKHGYLTRIVEAVNALDADVVAVTGDLVDGAVQHLAPHTAPLARLQARHGTYFVTGNHEYYSGAHGWIAELRRLGLRVLLNEHVVLEHGGATMVLAGVTDFTAHHFDPAHRSDPERALRGAPSNAAVRVLLAHQPRTAPAAAKAGFDVQLSGHTHGGQFFPWNFFVPMQQPWVAGLKRLDRMWVYISRGTGYWGPPKRFGAPSEITRVRLVRAAA